MVKPPWSIKQRLKGGGGRAAAFDVRSQPKEVIVRIAVFGAGGVGGYFGGRLAQAGEQVIFIARGDHLKAIQEKGLRVESIKGDFQVVPAQAEQEPRRVGEVDAVLVCVKAWQVPEAALAMAPMVGEDTFVVPMENGVDAPSQLASALGRERVLGGLCKVSAYIAAPGLIKHVGVQPYVAFGELDNRPSPRAERLRAAFGKSGVQVEIPADIQTAMWEKFLFIAAISGVGAVTRTPVGLFRRVPESRQMLQGAMDEIYALAKARQIDLPGDVIAKTMAFVDSLSGGVMASMQRDIEDGKPSELGSQNGAVARMGLESGVLTPINTYLYHSLLPQELQARGEIQI
jgi:2-dehydropantoate 2-reductase